MYAESQREVIPSRRQWEWVMLLHAFWDDSGSEPSSPIYVLGGVMLPKEWWTRVSEEWRLVLDHPPIVEYYKASEVWSDKPDDPFSGLTPKQRISKVNALVDVLITYHPVALACRLEWPIFKEFQQSHLLLDPANDPYFFLALNALVLVYKYGDNYGNLSRADFCFDRQNEIGKRVKDYYPIFKQRSPAYLAEWLPDEMEFGDEKKDIPLQCADMLAWHQRRALTNSLERDSDKNTWGQLSRHLAQLEIGIDELEAMATDLKMLV